VSDPNPNYKNYGKLIEQDPDVQPSDARWLWLALAALAFGLLLGMVIR
jgi:hypothetical protein